MKKLELNEVAKYEKAIKEKYGESAIKNPKSDWTKEKEQEYIKQMKQFYKKLQENQTSDRRDKRNGYLISRNFQKVKSTRECDTCGSYSFSHDDDVYFTKFGCCFNCYVQYIEGREERWNGGWRPNNTKAFND